MCELQKLTRAASKEQIEYTKLKKYSRGVAETTGETVRVPGSAKTYRTYDPSCMLEDGTVVGLRWVHEHGNTKRKTYRRTTKGTHGQKLDFDKKPKLKRQDCIVGAFKDLKL